MGKPRYEFPTASFPYKISRRLLLMSLPRRVYVDTGEGMPAFTYSGVRRSALRAHISDRINDAAYPYIRRLILTKKMYKNRFSQERLERMDKIIESVNTTMYTKLANCAIDLKKQDNKDTKKRRCWSESEWKKHMDYINQIAGPKKNFESLPEERGPVKPLDALMPRIKVLCSVPSSKMYRRLSQETWYRDPIKVPRGALKYVISDRVKKLATPRASPPQD